MTSILIPIADGSEEIEAVSLINILRRAGFDVTIAAVQRTQVTGSRSITLVADKLITDCQTESYDGIFLPGGMPGATNLSNSKVLVSMLHEQARLGKFYGAICASPAVVLAQHGLLTGKKATCYPGFESALPNSTLSTQAVVVDANCITAKSPACAQEFALSIIAAMSTQSAVDKIRQELC